MKEDAEIVICSIRSGKLMDGFRNLLSIHYIYSVVTSLCKRRYMPGKDSLHTGVKAVTHRGKGRYISG